MIFRLLLATLMLVQIAGTNRRESRMDGETLADTQAQANQHLYLPAVSYELPVQVVFWGEAADTFEPIYNHEAIGYVINGSTKPVYSVALLLRYTQYFSLGPPQLITYANAITLSPFFSATLPGQANPFYYGISNGNHTSTYFDDVHVIGYADSTPNDQTYVALDASQWSLGNASRIIGIVRNTSTVPVQDAQVVIMYMPTGPFNRACAWTQATLVTTTLQPGETTEYYGHSCGIGTPLLIAQGLVSP